MADPAQFRAYTSLTPDFTGNTTGVAPEYSGWMDEQLSWKSTCYVGDWTFVPHIGIKGPDALKLFSDLSVNSFSEFPLDRAKHCVMCNNDGKVISEGILLRNADDDFDYQVGTPQWVLYNLKKGDYNAEAYFHHSYKFQISGPTALAVCEELAGRPLRDVKFMRTTVVQLAGHDVTFLRQGMAGEIGYELQGPIQYHDAILEKILKVGKAHGMRRLGARNMMINHLEACYPTGSMHFYNALAPDDPNNTDYVKFMDENLPAEWQGTLFETRFRYNFSTIFEGSWDGDSITELYRSPVEMGWVKSIAFDHNFVGRKALEDEVANPQKQVVTLEFNNDDVKRIHASLFEGDTTYRQFEYPDIPYQLCWADWIMKDGKKIGHSTRPGYSHYFKKILSLSFIDAAYSKPGTEVEIVWGSPGTPQTLIKAKVCPAPYKQDQRRADLKKSPPYNLIVKHRLNE